MARVVCPHCGAGNREGHHAPTCWQCGKDLWEAPARFTYALDRLPRLPGTRHIGQDSSGTPVSRWAVLIASLALALSLAVLVTVLVVVLGGSRQP